MTEQIKRYGFKLSIVSELMGGQLEVVQYAGDGEPFVRAADYDALKVDRDHLEKGWLEKVEYLRETQERVAELEGCLRELLDGESGPKAEQPAAVDERAKFEAWQRKDGWKRPNDPGEWEAWQARAALAPAAVAVVMPERMTTIPEGKTISYAAGYEAALDAVANLNRNTVPLELLERIANKQDAAAFIGQEQIELRAILTGAKP